MGSLRGEAPHIIFPYIPLPRGMGYRGWGFKNKIFISTHHPQQREND
jgi:hypothetical protein